MKPDAYQFRCKWDDGTVSEWFEINERQMLNIRDNPKYEIRGLYTAATWQADEREASAPVAGEAQPIGYCAVWGVPGSKMVIHRSRITDEQQAQLAAKHWASLDSQGHMYVQAIYAAPQASEGNAAPSDEQCEKIYLALDELGRSVDRYEFGLPEIGIAYVGHEETRQTRAAAFKIIRDALRTE